MTNHPKITEIKIFGVDFLVVDVSYKLGGEVCKCCEFGNNSKMCDAAPPCGSATRSDRRNVIFVLKD